VEEPVRLIEIHCLSHIGGNKPVVLAAFRNAVNLYGQEHGDILRAELAREFHGL
jgi:hypothetical protein